MDHINAAQDSAPPEVTQRRWVGGVREAPGGCCGVLGLLGEGHLCEVLSPQTLPMAADLVMSCLGISVYLLTSGNFPGSPLFSFGG